MTRYAYTKGTGMVVVDPKKPPFIQGDETEELAVLRYYLAARDKFLEDISAERERIRELEKIIWALDEKYSDLRDKYPEEFV